MPSSSTEVRPFSTSLSDLEDDEGIEGDDLDASKVQAFQKLLSRRFDDDDDDDDDGLDAEVASVLQTGGSRGSRESPAAELPGSLIDEVSHHSSPQRAPHRARASGAPGALDTSEGSLEDLRVKTQSPFPKPAHAVDMCYTSENEKRREEKRAMKQGRNSLLALISAELENPGGGPKGHWLIDSRVFQSAVYFAICANALQMGLACDLKSGGWIDVWRVLDHTFTAFFLLEMILKIAFLRPLLCGYVADKANLFDAALVILAIVDNWLLPLILGGGDSPLSDFTLLRLLRLARLARLFRLLKVFKELWMILKGIIASFKALFWVCILLAILLYVAGIVCVDMIGRKGESVYPGAENQGKAFREEKIRDEFDAKLYFGSLPRSMYTLFSLAIMAEWQEFGRPMLEYRPAMLPCFIAFIIFTNFGLMNVIVSVIVETTMESSRSMEEAADKEDMNKKLYVLTNIQDTVFELDEDNSGSLSVDELKAGASKPEVTKLLEMVNLPEGFSPQALMDLLDMDGNREMSNDEFMKGFYRLIKSDNFQTTCNTTVILNQLRKEVLDADVQISQAVSKVMEKLEHVEKLAARAIAAQALQRPETSLT